MPKCLKCEENVGIEYGSRLFRNRGSRIWGIYISFRTTSIRGQVRFKGGSRFFTLEQVTYRGVLVSTAGYISEDKVKRYIEEQKKHERIHQWNISHPKGKQGRLN